MHIDLINYASVKPHLDWYISFVEKLTEVAIHVTEADDLYLLMLEAATMNSAYQVSDNDLVYGYVYLLPIGKLRANIVCFHMVRNSTKALELLIDFMYSLGKIMRYTPKEVNCVFLAPVLQPVSHSLYKQNRSEHIKLLPTLR